MKERRDGVILNIIGYAGERLNARYIVGTTANAGLMAFTRSVGSKASDFGVRVLGGQPGLHGDRPGGEAAARVQRGALWHARPLARVRARPQTAVRPHGAAGRSRRRRRHSWSRRARPM